MCLASSHIRHTHRGSGTAFVNFCMPGSALPSETIKSARASSAAAALVRFCLKIGLGHWPGLANVCENKCSHIHSHSQSCCNLWLHLCLHVGLCPLHVLRSVLTFVATSVVTCGFACGYMVHVWLHPGCVWLQLGLHATVSSCTQICKHHRIPHESPRTHDNTKHM